MSYDKIFNTNLMPVAFVFWLPITGVIYGFVPMKYGNLMLDSCFFVWAVILSYFGAR